MSELQDRDLVGGGWVKPVAETETPKDTGAAKASATVAGLITSSSAAMIMTTAFTATTRAYSETRDQRLRTDGVAPGVTAVGARPAPSASSAGAAGSRSALTGMLALTGPDTTGSGGFHTRTPRSGG